MKYLNYTKGQLIQEIMELEEINEQLRELSSLDGLTKVSNQRKLLTHLSLKINEADKIRIPLCIILFDIDDFKRINDTMGHVYGNAVLTSLAEIIQGNLRETDLVGRFGGDEFMVILTNTDVDTAQGIAERIRHVVEETIFLDGLHITISGGIKQYDSGNFMDLIHFADMNMYKAKQCGKNKIR